MHLIILFLVSLVVSIGESDPVGLKIGEKAPDFTVIDQNGKQVSLSETLKKGKVVLTFYRGAWCRYCMKQMKDYQDSLSLVSEAGATIIAISPEHEAGIWKTVETAGVEFSLIRDLDLKIMLDYAVISKEKVEDYRNKSKETEEDITRKYVPVPALYIINGEGFIEYVSFNPDYKERMSVRTILEELK
jgi:peroxiredoxin